MINKGMMSSNTDQWATPQYFFDNLAKEFYFVLDVCADKSNHKCKEYFTKEQNGLSKDWREYMYMMGNCVLPIYSRAIWMNPPYGKEIGKWVNKAHDSGCQVVGLLPARTDTKWFHDYIYGKAEIRFVKGRLKFGDSKNSAPFPSMVVIWRHKGGHLL